MATRKSENKKTLKCMNWNPETSKWGDWAPEEGCRETVEVDENVTKVLCWRCTSKTTTMNGEYRPWLK